ncbi:hypothetical protein PQ455_07210 [Sphingomonas naphthae]|uniref:Uncharacterized protein n=1 Tax=Sphingomonas naphthae TaxID=1813468 RepID=A0ABY7TRZ8_9SPHN|nr:hypothetical protein [Sphingomonas naphthae]WCT74999.1 hypothetical protein PQ455_07210 [Sphingomonas naphthae]
MPRTRFALPLLLLATTTAHAQDYGSGWAVPTIDIAASIGNDVITREIGLEVLRKEQGRPASAAATPRATDPHSASLFGSAMTAPRNTKPTDTSFARDPQASDTARRNILAALARRQPEAVAEYRPVIEKMEFGRAFADVTKGYRLRGDDLTDTMAAYWVMAWVIANKADLPPPATAAAVRDQVARGIALTPVAGYDATRRQVLADELIFNFLILNASWRNEQAGPRYPRLSDGVQSSFLPLGADLRRLTLSPGGFARH